MLQKKRRHRWGPPSPNTVAAGLAAGALKFAELEATVLFRGELKVKDWGPDDSDVANLGEGTKKQKGHLYFKHYKCSKSKWTVNAGNKEIPLIQI